VLVVFACTVFVIYFAIHFQTNSKISCLNLVKYWKYGKIFYLILKMLVGSVCVGGGGDNFPLITV
jgi:hypothetical protein